MSEIANVPFADRRLAMLQRLAELGMVMAEKLAAEPEVTAESAMQFARVSKAVRQAIGLEHRLVQDQARAQSYARARDPIGEVVDRHLVKRERVMDGFKRKVGLAQLVAMTYEDHFDEGSRDRIELDEELDAFVEPGLEDDLFLDRPAGDIIVEILTGLDLVPDDSETFNRADWRAAMVERYAVFDRDLASSDPAWPARPPPGSAHQRPPDG